MIRVYNNNPTTGLRDGNVVSQATGANPVDSGYITSPPAGYENGAWIKLAARCDVGYETILYDARYAQISIEDSTGITMWQLAPDLADSPDEPLASGWGDPLNFAAQIDDNNTVFWARARVNTVETIGNETDVDVRITASVGLA